MTRFKTLLATVAAVTMALESTNAVAITSVKTVNLLHNNNNSPFFTTTADGANTFAGASDGGGTFTPVNAPKAGQVTSLTTHGVFSIVGDSTSVGGWTNNNGVPAGITLTFNADITFSVGDGSPANSYLTLTQSGTNRGDGLGIAQGIGGTSTLDSGSVNGVANEVLAASAVTVSDVSYSGTLAETGFNFTPGTVGNFGPYIIRSSGFTENGETAALVSANNAVDPDGLGRPTIGFGVPSEGFVASNISIENGFTNTTVTTNGVGHGTYFSPPRQVGAFTFTMLNGTMGFKGIGYEYDVNFDIAPVATPITGDYNHNGVVDAADYVVWRNGDIAADANNDTLVDQADYDIWRANFGNTAGAGAGSALGSATVPEPATCGLLVMGLLTVCSRRNSASR
jgi:hypothetical protein